MRLGCLPYLNVKPLVYSLEHGQLPEGWELVYAPPSELAKMLYSGEIAAAPVSSFATFTNPALEVCPGICIASDGPVQSVLLLSRNGPPKLDTVALDTSSLSGAAMLRIILKEAYGLEPEFVRMSPAPVSGMLDVCGAALVIGNPAMLYPNDGLHVFDVGEEWKRLTGLPAVFALWAGMQMTPDLVQVLRESKLRGISRIPEISREESGKLGLPNALVCHYLSRTIVYDFGERERQGLSIFRQKCIEHGLVQGEASVGVRDGR